MARQSQPHYDVIVIGAGAAGMMCAATAGQRGRSVLLVDHYPKLGEKIRISGGGRCNFTNLHASPANYLSRNPHFCRSALARYTPRHFIALVEKHRIAYHEKTLGQLFCDDSATQVIAMLKAECDAGGVEWRMPCEVRAVARDGAGFRVDTAAGPVTSASLVVATGGLTVPKIGATPFGYRLAEQFGLAVVPPKPALVPLSLDPQALSRYGDLSGVSLEAEVSCRGARFRESLPKRFAQAWCQAHGLEKPVAELSDKALRDAAIGLADWPVHPSGTLGYNKAEVTLGGVDTRGLSSKTMEAAAVPGLYFIGEVVDVTGHLGGYNFQWAWASGHAAGEAA